MAASATGPRSESASPVCQAPNTLASPVSRPTTNQFLESTYHLHAGEVFRFARGLTGSTADAEDILSETFIRAWNGTAPIHVATMRGYLFTIARNVFLRHRERALRARGARVGKGCREPSSSPSDQLAAREQLGAVAKAIQELPEMDRTALMLRIRHELPYEEIARCLGLSVAAAKVKVHRARRALVTVIETEEHPCKEHP